MDKAALDDWERRIVANAGAMPESTDASIGDFDVDLSWGGVNSTSMIINLMSTLLYTVSFYDTLVF
jgi:hypothetical protein